MTDANKRIVREFVQNVFNDHSPDSAHDYLAAEAKWHGGILGTFEGRENFTALLRGFLAAFPDLHATEQDMAAEGDLVAVRFVVEATHKGDLLGIPPTGRRVRWDAVDVYRIVNGKIVEEWAADDMAAILHQVGAYSPPWVK